MRGESQETESAEGNYTSCSRTPGVSLESLPFVLQSMASGRMRRGRETERRGQGKKQSEKVGGPLYSALIIY